MRPMKLFLFVGLFCLLLSCEKKPEKWMFHGKTMGTTYNVAFYPKDPGITKSEIERDITKLLQEVNQVFSTYIEHSEISQINKAGIGKKIKVSPAFGKVMKFALEVSKHSEGYFDPTVGPLVNLWGFGPDGERKIPRPEQISQMKESVGFEHLEYFHDTLELIKKKEGLYLDFSAIAKGYGVDVLTGYFKNIKGYGALIEIGGEICTYGRKGDLKPWSVGIERPEYVQASRRAVKALHFEKGECMATSGDYRNYFSKDKKRYSHTIDPKSGRPVERPLASVSVVSYQGCMHADAYATAILASGLEKGQKLIDKLGLTTFLILPPQGQKIVRFKSTGKLEQLQAEEP